MTLRILNFSTSQSARLLGAIGAALVLAMLSSGCVRVPLSRTQDPIPESPIDLGTINRVINPATALSAITGRPPARDHEADQDMLAMSDERPLFPGEEGVFITSRSNPRIAPRRYAAEAETLGYFATSRGFETPPIDPLGQVTMFDRPLYQR